VPDCVFRLDAATKDKMPTGCHLFVTSLLSPSCKRVAIGRVGSDGYYGCIYLLSVRCVYDKYTLHRIRYAMVATDAATWHT
jgi:hypothetical protein